LPPPVLPSQVNHKRIFLDKTLSGQSAQASVTTKLSSTPFLPPVLLLPSQVNHKRILLDKTFSCLSAQASVTTRLSSTPFLPPALLLPSQINHKRILLDKTFSCVTTRAGVTTHAFALKGHEAEVRVAKVIPPGPKARTGVRSYFTYQLMIDGAHVRQSELSPPKAFEAATQILPQG
jgi:hypothetical protein